MNKPAWAAFWLVGFIWGSSFLLISIGVEDIPATQISLVRAVTAAIGLNLVRMWRGKTLPTDWPTIRAFIYIGAGNAAVPYTLIGLGEQTITSGMAAVLQATVALFTLVIAHYAFADERITPQKIIGLVVGFSGVVVLSSKSIDGGEINTPMLLGQFAIIAASLSYAIFAVYSRKVIRRKIDPIVIASGTFIPAVAWSALFMFLEPLLGGRSAVSLLDLQSDVLLAVLGLGFVNTFIAYLFFYYIIQQLGAFRATMVTYIIPPIGLFLGWLVLGEAIETLMLLGTLMIFAGIAIVNLKPEQIRQYRARRVAAKEKLA